MATNIGTLFAQIGMPTATLKADTARANSIFRTFSAKATRSLATTQGAIAALGFAAGGGFLVASSVKAGSRFEQVMTEVGGVARATDAELRQLTETTRGLGEVTEFTATQAGEAAKALSLAGFAVKETIGALPGVLDLATAGSVDLGRSAQIAANSLRAFRLPVEELSRVNDVLVGTFTRSNTTLETLSESFRFSAPVAKAFNVSIEKLAAMLGILGNSGITGSMAGTQLAFAMQKATEAAGKFGFQSSDLIDVIEQLNRRGTSTLEFMKIFGLRGGRAVLVMKDLIPQVRAFEETLHGVGGESKTLADKMRKTIIGAFNEMRSVFESLQIDIFEVFRKGLVGTIRGLTEFMRNNRDSIVSFARDILKFLGFIKEAVAFVFNVIAGVAGPIIGIFQAIRTEFGETEKRLKKLEEQTEQTGLRFAEFRIVTEELLEPPDFSPWLKFWTFISKHAGDSAKAFRFLADTIGEFIDTFMTQVDAMGSGVFGFISNMSGALGALRRGNFTVAKDMAESALEAFTGAFEKGTVASAQFRDQLAKDWDEYQKSLERRSASEILFTEWSDDIGDLWEHAREARDKYFRETEQAFMDLVAPVPFDFPVFPNLPKPPKTGEGEDTNEGTKRKVSPFDLTPVVEPSDIISPHMMQDWTNTLVDWARITGAEVHSMFSDTIFNVMTADWEGLVRTLENIWNSFVRRIADAVANELVVALDVVGGIDLSGNFGDAGMAQTANATSTAVAGLGTASGTSTTAVVGLGTAAGAAASVLASLGSITGAAGFQNFASLLGGVSSGQSAATTGVTDAAVEGLKHFATGGIVTGPTMAMIGEKEPEAVIPLSRISAVMDRIDGGRDSGPPELHLHQNIETPDPPSFRASRTQLLAEGAGALARAARRFG